MQRNINQLKVVGRIILKQFARDDRGVIAILCSMTIILLILSSGGTVDYGLAIQKRAELQQAADAAVLAAAKGAGDYLKANSGATEAEWKQVAEQTGLQTFLSNLSDPNVKASSSINIDVTNNEGEIQAVASFTGQHSTYFLKLINIDNIDVTGHAVASTGKNGFVRINYVVDLSPSMGIGATGSDQQTLDNRIGCAIACHYEDTWGARDTLAAARASGATLRIDVVRNSIASMLQKFKSLSNGGDGYEIAIYGFSNSLINIIQPTTDIDAAITAAQNIELTGLVAQGGTNLRHSLQQLSEQSANSGDGSSTSERKIFTVLMTDGVENSIINYLNNPNRSSTLMRPARDPNFVRFSPWEDSDPVETSQGFNPVSCDPLKNKNHTILAINVEYLIPTIWYGSDSLRFNFIDDTLKPKIESNMAACVSNANLMFNASSPTEIADAADLLFASITAGTPHLTQ